MKKVIVLAFIIKFVPGVLYFNKILNLRRTFLNKEPSEAVYKMI